MMKLQLKNKHNVSQISTPDANVAEEIQQVIQSQDSDMNIVNNANIDNNLITSRNLRDIYQNDYYQDERNNVYSPRRNIVKFRENQHAKKYTTPIQSNPDSAYQSLNSMQNLNVQQTEENQDHQSSNSIQFFNNSTNNFCQNVPNAGSPSAVKIIDLRNSQIRKLVMDSLNEIIQERKRLKPTSNRHLSTQSYQSMLSQTPQSLKVQNSIDESQIMLIERIQNNQDIPQTNNQEQNTEQISRQSRPPSRIASVSNQNGDQILQEQQVNNGIYRMSPRSQQKFFTSLEKIYQEQDQQNLRSGLIEEPNSPEYTIVRALDNSCVLFQVKENQPNTVLTESDGNSGYNSGLKLQSPNIQSHFHDNDENPDILSNCENHQEMMQQLTQRLQGIENQENQPITHRRNQLANQQAMRAGLYVESISIDKQFLMIHPKNLKMLTPSIKAPQISRQPSIQNIDYFDMSLPYHLQILCQRLNDLRIQEEMQEQSASNQSLVLQEQNNQDEIFQEQSEQIHQQVSLDNQATLFLSYEHPDQSSGQDSTTKTPLPSRMPVSRGEGQEIDIDLLIAKLLDIPNDELIESIFNMSVQDVDQVMYNQKDFEDPINQNEDVQEESNEYFSTPIQARIFYEKGYLNNGGKPLRGLDLRSPQTKFNLMRKLQEVKEQNHSSEEDEEELRDSQVAGYQLNEYRRIQQNVAQIQQHQSQQIRGPLMLRAVNDFSRLYINEEDEDDESQEDCRSIQDKERETTQHVSLISPQRSLNSTFNNIQLRNLNQNQPSIELLIQKLKRLEDRRLNQGISRLSHSQSHYSSETDSPQKIDTINNSKGLSQSNSVGNFNINNSGSASNILEQVIKRLEKLKRSRDPSV
eukprot:403345949